MREDEFYNRIHEARNQFLKARNIDPKKYAEQEIYFKAIQVSVMFRILNQFWIFNSEIWSTSLLKILINFE